MLTFGSSILDSIVPRPDDRSFPSSHTGASFEGVAALSLHESRLRIPAPAVLIGFSRLYLHVHDPDVLAGAALGALLGGASCALVSRVEDRRAIQERR